MSATGTRFRRALRHAQTPGSLPGLLWKNIKYALASRRPEYWNERARRLAARGYHDEALRCFDRALSIRNGIPRTWVDRGGVLFDLDRHDEAETSLREALRLDPSFARAHRELARVLDALRRYEDAEAAARRALGLDPEQAVAHGMLGTILYHRGRAAEAQASFRAALKLQPKNPAWHVSLGFALMLAGELREGWSEYEWRWGLEDSSWIRPVREVPFWTGEPIGNRTILLMADQAQGDTLQFCRFVPQVAAGAGRTVLAVAPSLIRLLSRLPGVSEVVSRHKLPSRPDLWCGIMSLPHLYGTTLDTIPATVPYVSAAPEDVARWRERLAGFAGLRVGLCWAGGQDRHRAMRPEAMASFAEIPAVHLFSLQKNPPSTVVAPAPHGMVLHDFTSELNDFADTAALIENLDLVVSVDTAVAHLAGALGKPIWLLNRFETCWRWLQNRPDSPWYPTLRQFRQTMPGDWDSAVARARDALSRLAAGDRGQLSPTARD